MNWIEKENFIKIIYGNVNFDRLFIGFNINTINSNILNKYKKIYSFIIFHDISKNMTVDFFKNITEKLLKNLNTPIVLICSLKNNFYRKPSIGMYDNIFPDGIDKVDIYFSDLSDIDVKFAHNIDANLIKGSNKIPNIYYPKYEVGLYNRNYPTIWEKEVIINVGMSGSGKSYFTKNILEPLGFVRINRDILKTKKKCFDKCIDLMLSNTHKIVIDNTNPSILSRAPYISAAIFYGYKISCLLFTCGETRCKHNNRYRNYVSLGGIPYTPNIAYNIYKKKYEKPTKYEGFDRIAEIPFLYEGIYMDKIKYDMYYL